MTQRDPKDSRLSPLLGLSLGALGVVYGDIGTSPLYALRECFFGPHSVPPDRINVLGVMSLIFWSLIIVISIKYLVFVMRADNRGEGGILALMALLRTGHSRRRGLLIAMGLFGAALLYGDGMITPAISVLSAVEGLEVATPFFDPYVIPITLAILIVLFLIQRRGTEGIGKLFGPVMMVWFVTLAVLGLRWIIREPAVLAAVNPWYAVRFFAHAKLQGFLVLGSVFLVVTGGEALYADMGHFGRRPIRFAWFTLVLPALLLNYFGQGALLLARPGEVEHPFYNLRSLLGALPSGRAGHGGHVDRFAGGDLGRLLAHPPGRAARLLPAHGDHPHVGGGDRADLHPGGQLGAHDLHPRPGAGLPGIDQPGRRLRHRRHHDHGHHDDPGLRSGARDLGMEDARRGRPDRGFPGAGRLLLRRQHRQDPPGRLVPAGGGGPHLPADGHLEEGDATSWPRGCARRPCPSNSSSTTSSPARRPGSPARRCSSPPTPPALP